MLERSVAFNRRQTHRSISKFELAVHVSNIDIMTTAILEEYVQEYAVSVQTVKINVGNRRRIRLYRRISKSNCMSIYVQSITLIAIDHSPLKSTRQIRR